MRRRPIFWGLLLLWLEPFAVAAAERHALVIGNAAYRGEPVLRNTVNDARDMATVLKRLGYTVTTLENADGRALRRGINDYLERIRGSAGIAVLYYSGHGVQDSQRNNYLLPVDADVRQESHIRADGVGLNPILEQLGQRPDGAVSLVIDARVRVMSIAPAYRDGIDVKPGKHRIRVERSGYEAYDQWVDVNQAKQVVMVDLQKHVSIPNPPNSPSPSELFPAEITFEGNQTVAALLDSVDRYVKNNQLSEAGAALERALRIEPRNAGVWHDLAQVRLHQGQYQQAESLASKSNILAGANRALQARNWRLIAVARKATGNTAGAAEAEIQTANFLTP